MRDGVVHVQQIQMVTGRYFRHPGSQSQAVGWVLKQRICRNLHLVVVDPRQPVIEPDRVGVTDEMHLMAASGQFQPKFGGNNSTSTISWIASYADLHMGRVPFEYYLALSTMRK